MANQLMEDCYWMMTLAASMMLSESLHGEMRGGVCACVRACVSVERA